MTLKGKTKQVLMHFNHKSSSCLLLWKPERGRWITSAKTSEDSVLNWSHTVTLHAFKTNVIAKRKWKWKLHLGLRRIYHSLPRLNLVHSFFSHEQSNQKCREGNAGEEITEWPPVCWTKHFELNYHEYISCRVFCFALLKFMQVFSIVIWFDYM